MNTPRATYRLQLNPQFTFADASAQVDYLARLGISHVYLSPVLTARSGSTHGYDVIDYGMVNPELGGEEGLRALVANLRAHDMGVIVDIVPNHMAVGGNDNALWLDLLEWGRDSRYANFFDIDWDVPDPALTNHILAPFLGETYGEALTTGKLRFGFDTTRGRFHVDYFEHRFPLAAKHYSPLLRLGGSALKKMQCRFRSIFSPGHGGHRDLFMTSCADLAQQYAVDNEVRAAIDQLLRWFDPQTATGQRLLHQLLERQHYRLANWRTAADEINWRRFFDIIQLAGIRIQEPAAFELVHSTIFRLYAEGLIDGIRIDHIDGLADPRTYCRRLHKRLRQLARLRPQHAPVGPAYVIVEKILAPEERLPREWQVDGTTGYSFMNDVSALLHDPTGEAGLTELWIHLSGRFSNFEAESQQARRWILKELLAAEFNACAHALHQVARSDPMTRDWSQLAIRRVLEELLVQFPIYRTYADARGRSEANTEIMQTAIAAARSYCRLVDRPLLDLIDRWLGAEPLPARLPRLQRRMRLRAITRFQQLCSPLAAKSVEDTAFYRHGRLLSRNEVGANPAQFANSPNDFHNECVRRATYFPKAMLATATHDHKRGEDLRARLAVLSEIPHHWADRVQQWMETNRRHKSFGQPLQADEYMLYQMLIGGWPLSLDTQDVSGLQELRNRLQQWRIKALREAKQLSSWSSPNLDYEQSCHLFLRNLFDSGQAPHFLEEVADFAHHIAPAGIVNSLSQTLLKLTTPGVPDIYQGCELWDFSFVDPDNRRPVDYAQRNRLLDSCAASNQDWRSGAIKQHLIARLLDLRKAHPELFLFGSYQPLEITGNLANHVFAFARQWRRITLIVATVRLPATLVLDRPHVDPGIWGNTQLHFPPPEGDSVKQTVHWKDCDSTSIFPEKITVLPCATLFRTRTYALLLKDDSTS